MMKTEQLTKRLEEMLTVNNISLNAWQNGYTDNDVESVLPIFDKFLVDNGIEAEIWMIWEHYNEDLDSLYGSSNLWLINEEQEGVELFNPLSSKESLHSFVEHAVAFQNQATHLEAIEISPCSNFNAY